MKKTLKLKDLLKPAPGRKQCISCYHRAIRYNFRVYQLYCAAYRTPLALMYEEEPKELEECSHYSNQGLTGG